MCVTTIATKAANQEAHTLVGSLSLLSSAHCRATSSSLESPGRASSMARAAAAEGEEDAGATPRDTAFFLFSLARVLFWCNTRSRKKGRDLLPTPLWSLSLLCALHLPRQLVSLVWLLLTWHDPFWVCQQRRTRHAGGMAARGKDGRPHQGVCSSSPLLPPCLLPSCSLALCASSSLACMVAPSPLYNLSLPLFLSCACGLTSTTP